jgi:hypothetical protein
MRYTQSNNILGSLTFNSLTIEHNLTANFDHFAQSTQHGGFTRTVGTQQSSDTALLDFHRQTMQNFGATITGKKVFDFQKHSAHFEDPK